MKWFLNQNNLLVLTMLVVLRVLKVAYSFKKTYGNIVNVTQTMATNTCLQHASNSDY